MISSQKAGIFCLEITKKPKTISMKFCQVVQLTWLMLTVTTASGDMTAVMCDGAACAAPRGHWPQSADGVASSLTPCAEPWPLHSRCPGRRCHCKQSTPAPETLYFI